MLVLDINLHLRWTMVFISARSFEDIFIKTALYLTKHKQKTWTGSEVTCFREYGSLLHITIIAEHSF